LSKRITREKDASRGIVTPTMAWKLKVEVMWRMTISCSPPIPTGHHPTRGLAYARFTLSYCDVEELLVERGLEVSYEMIKRWVLKFGPLFARELRRRRFRPTFGVASRRDGRDDQRQAVLAVAGGGW
jgi:hypothetical protein